MARLLAVFPFPLPRAARALPKDTSVVQLFAVSCGLSFVVPRLASMSMLGRLLCASWYPHPPRKSAVSPLPFPTRALC
jgi:hypothetical protein